MKKVIQYLQSIESIEVASPSKSTKLSEFDRGALMAVSLLMATHDQPVIAADVLNAMGLETADCSELDVYDKENLRTVQGELGGHVKLRGLGRKQRG